MESICKQVLLLTVISSIGCLAHDLGQEYSTSTSTIIGGHSFKNSSTIILGSPDPLSVIHEANDLIFKEILTCPNGTSDDVQKCIRAINALVFETCTVLKSVYDCSYDGMLKCEGAKKGVAKLFANKFNEDLKREGCTELFPVSVSTSASSSTSTSCTENLVYFISLCMLYFYFNLCFK